MIVFLTVSPTVDSGLRRAWSAKAPRTELGEAQAAPVETTVRLIRNPSPFNFYGIPTISIPCGFSRDGLPIGLQISGPPLGELDTLALAHAYEQATPWNERTPDLG